MNDGYPPDVLNPLCPSREILALISDKWTLLAMTSLSNGTARYNDLQRNIGGISQKMLTQTLRGLERNGLIARTVYPVIPPKVEYNLTDLGRSLIPAIKSMGAWAMEHIPAVKESQETYDTKIGSTTAV